MSKLFKIRLIVTVLIIAILASVISVAIVIEKKSSVIVIGDNVVLDDKTHELPKNLVFAVSNTVSNSEPFTEKSVKLTATVKPEHATNKALNWSVDWVNSQSNWASGKNISDYLTLSSDGVTATLTCKAPFGEKANIVAQSVDNANAKATCVIDFLSDFKIRYSFFTKKENVYQEFGHSVLNKKVVNAFPDYDGDQLIPHNPSIKLIDFDYDEETIKENNQGLEYFIKLTTEFTLGTVRPIVSLPNQIRATMFSSSFEKLIGDKYDIMFQNINLDLLLDIQEDNYYKVSTYSLMKYLGYLCVASNFSIDNFFRESFNNCSFEFVAVKTCRYTYNGIDIGGFTPRICFGIDEKTCKYFNVKTVSFDKVNDYLTF